MAIRRINFDNLDNDIYFRRILNPEKRDGYPFVFYPYAVSIENADIKKYIKYKFPNRTYREDFNSDYLYKHELAFYGIKNIVHLDEIIERFYDLFVKYENDFPPAHTNNKKYKFCARGVVRVILHLSCPYQSRIFEIDSLPFTGVINKKCLPNKKFDLSKNISKKNLCLYLQYKFPDRMHPFYNEYDKSIVELEKKLINNHYIKFSILDKYIEREMQRIIKLEETMNFTGEVKEFSSIGVLNILLKK